MLSSIIIEHLPQLIVELIVIFIKLDHISTVAFIALIVSLIDIIYIIVKAFIWTMLKKSKNKNKKRFNGDAEQTQSLL